MDKENYLWLLKKSVVEIQFTKMDGTDRIMNVTLKEDLLPKRDKDFSGRAPTHPLDVISCYDVDECSWKSFNVNKVKAVNAL